MADIVEVHIGGIDALQQRIAELEDALKWIDFNTIDVGARRVCKEALKEQDE